MARIKMNAWKAGAGAVADTGSDTDSDDCSEGSVYCLSSDSDEECRDGKEEEPSEDRTCQPISSPEEKTSTHSMEQSAEALLADLEGIRDKIQEAIIENEYDQTTGTPCDCGRDNKRREYRCYDCIRMDVMCDVCLIERHRLCPFHRAERWNGLFFERVDLSTLGHILYLGHRGKPCPSTRTHDVSTMTACHTNGFHKVNVAYCQCADRREDAIQLVRHGLFPASKSRPKTAFTHAVLRAFHTDTIVSKKSGYDFLNTLAKLTNNHVPLSDLTHQFMRITHLWNALCAERWSGALFNFDDKLLGRPQGSYALPCLACPIPGFNTDSSLLDDYLNAKYMSMDANFHLGGLLKEGNNQSEVPIWDGRGYMRREKDIQKHLEHFGHMKEQKSDCSEFTAIQNALLTNSLKYKNQYASGQVAVLCRHGLVVPEGVVNLQMGERHINVDLALSGALKSAAGIPRINLSYDINCQYSKDVVNRFERQFPDQAEIVRSKVKFYIGSFHVVGHKSSCQYRFSLGFGSGTGRTDGEEVERYWSEMNQISGSIKQMTPGHRSDTLDMFNAGWNWMKLQNLCDALYNRHRDALVNAHKHSVSFKEFDGTLRRALSSAVVDKWARSSTDAEWDSNTKEWRSVYKLEEKPLPSLRSGSNKLGLSKRVSHDACNREDFVYLAIQLEQKQLAMRTNPDESDNKKRLELSAEIQRWITLMPRFMPKVDVRHAPSVENVESFRITLPSFFSEHERKERGLDELAAVERKLREAQAYDALCNLKDAIRNYEQVRVIKSKFGHGKYAHTRTGRAQANATDAKHYYKQEYRDAYRALGNLGFSHESSPLRALKDEDMHRESLTEPHELGSGRKAMGWIWSIGWEHLESNEVSESLEENRVRWFRARAVRDRWKEEVELLEKESERLIKGLEQMSSYWKTFAEKECDHSGRSAYMERKSHMYAEMSTYAQNSRLCGDSVQEPVRVIKGSPKRRKRKDDQAVKEAKRFRREDGRAGTVRLSGS